MAFIFALLTLFGWGVGDVILAVASRRTGFLVAFFWFLLGGFILSLFYLPFAPNVNDYQMLILSFIIGAVHYSGNITYLRALEVGNASLTGAIAGSFPIVTVLLSLIFFGERLNFGQTLGIIFTSIGVILASFKFEEIKKLNLYSIFSDKAVLCSLITMLIWGFAFAFVRIPAENLGWFWATMPGYLLFVPLIFISKIRQPSLAILKDTKSFLPVFLFILFVTMADFSYNIGILHGYTSVVAPVAGSSSVLFVLLTRFFFREKLTRQQKIGIVFSLIGIVLISLSR